MKYTIQTKQKNYFAGLIYKSVDDVINAIIFYDLIPPFKVFDETKKDIKLLLNIELNYHHTQELHHALLLRSQQYESQRVGISLNRQF